MASHEVRLESGEDEFKRSQVHTFLLKISCEPTQNEGIACYHFDNKHIFSSFVLLLINFLHFGKLNFQ